MADPEVRKLIAQGETFSVEFKSGHTDIDQVVEAVTCLANGNGGTLLWGVRDDGVINGVTPRHGATTNPRRIEAQVASKTEPALQANCSVKRIDGRDIVMIEVQDASGVIATTKGKYLRRALDVRGEPQCLPMRPYEVVARAGAVGAHDYARVVIPELTVDDLSESEFGRLRELASSDGDESLVSLSASEILTALNLRTIHDELTVGALLLFGTPSLISERLPAYEAEFQELDGLEVRTRDVGPKPLLRAMVEIVDRVRARNPEEEIEIGLVRVGLPRFAGTTIRELIANALVHRDYTAMGPTLIEVKLEALEVSNPGGLPVGVTIANLLTTPPRPRNPVLADAFKRAGFVERTGRGINRAFVGQLALGRPAPDYTRCTPNDVIVQVRSGPADKELAAFIAEYRQTGRDLKLEDLLTLHEIRHERRITTARAAELFQVDNHKARATLNRLTDMGLVEARGSGKGRAYHLAASVYRQLGESAEYVRTAGFDDIQQEQMALTFVERHGSITRRDAIKLCKLSPDNASRLLRRLRDQGKLQMVGKKGGAHYVKPPRQ